MHCAPVARVCALTPGGAALCRARSTMPRRRGDGPGHTRARRKAQEAAVRGLVTDAVAEAHEAHAAARCDLTGSARAFLNETALPAVRALNGAGGPTLLPAMHRIVNAVQPGLIRPEAALYGHWMEWRESNRSGRPLSMGDTEADSDPRGHLGVTWGVYLCAGKPPLADIILSHPPELTRCDSVIGLAIPATSGHIQNRGAAS